MADDFEYVAKKLELSVAELKHIFERENKTFRDYKNKMRLISLPAQEPCNGWDWEKGFSDDSNYSVGNIRAFVHVYKQPGIACLFRMRQD